ncbi:Rossmann fold nucleotide-binding protein Smf [Bacillus sp. JCM 19045]|nr:Rossmann fold nucleotide-binding protein Smf [Bacillus sp. JCM 19045]
MSTFLNRLTHVHAVLYEHHKAFARLLVYDPDLTSVYRYTTLELMHVMNAKESVVERLKAWLKKTDAEAYANRFLQADIYCISQEDPLYPPLLKQIYNPPTLLYAKGNKSLLATKKASVVGTRTPTVYGLKTSELLIPTLIEANVTVVSGLARGIDRSAHEQAIAHQGNTIAVTASGFQTIYPPEHKLLFHSIATNHLVLTEYPPFIKPKKWHFPIRNRIISGMSYATIIIEAKRKSGSLITADLALDQGRYVFAVPGQIVSEQSAGVNGLIQQGAYCICNQETFAETMPEFMSKNSEPSRFT